MFRNGIYFRQSFSFRCFPFKRPNNNHQFLTYSSNQLKNVAWSSSSGPKVTPRLIYVQNPWSWMSNKIRLKMLQYTWDKEFKENDFKRGVKQATVVLNSYVRSNKLHEIERITTPRGFVQISKDLQVSRNDPRVHMMQFRTDDIRRTIPVRVYFIESKSRRRHCFIDMFLVGLRRAGDMTDTERMAFWSHLHQYDKSQEMPKWGSVPPNHDGSGEPVVFAEMYVRFHKEYSATSANQWNIAYYKVASFDVLSL